MSPDADITSVMVDGRRLRLTHLDKVMYPATETTKGEILHYYAAVAPRLLAQLDKRPVTRVRFPHGTKDASFFEKNAPAGMPSWIPTCDLDGVRYPFIESVAALTYFANLSWLFTIRGVGVV